MALWKITNKHYFGPPTSRDKLSKKVRKKIKPWVAVYIGPDYHDAKAVGRFDSWEQACEYVRSGGTPFVHDGVTKYER